MLFIKSLTSIALATSVFAIPVAKPEAKNVFNYEVVNVDGSNFKQTSSLVEFAKRAYVTETIGYTSTSVTVVPGNKKTVYVTADDAPAETTAAADQVTTAPEPTLPADIQNKGASQTLTVIDGTTYLVSKVVSTIRPATTYTYESTYTSTIDGVVQTGVSTIVTSSTADPTTVDPTTAAETTTNAAEQTSSTTLSPSTPVPTSAAPTSTSSSSSTTPSSTSTPAPTTTAAPTTSSSSSESGVPYTTVVAEDGVCEIYYDDGDDDIYYVSGSEAASASSTTTITSIIYQTQTI